MKKILTTIALSIAAVAAQAQTKLVCHKDHCYKTKYAQNFKVCKDEYGYKICGEQRSATNSTRPVAGAKLPAAAPVYATADAPVYSMRNSQTALPKAAVPQNQSYSAQETINPSSYGGYRRSKIKVCYLGDNVAGLNKAPYQGCPSDAWDGPEKNNNRNINVANPVHLAPSGGNGGRGL